MTMSVSNLVKIACPAFALCALCLFPHNAEAKASDADSGKAVVRDGPLQVHSEPSAQSKVVRSLGKGTTVTVEIEMATDDGSWCGITEQGKSSLSGYVPCDTLERRKKAPVVWKSIGSKGAAGPPGAQSLSVPEKSKRPYSDISAILYMTTW